MMEDIVGTRKDLPAFVKDISNRIVSMISSNEKRDHTSEKPSKPNPSRKRPKTSAENDGSSTKKQKKLRTWHGIRKYLQTFIGPDHAVLDIIERHHFQMKARDKIAMFLVFLVEDSFKIQAIKHLLTCSETTLTTNDICDITRCLSRDENKVLVLQQIVPYLDDEARGLPPIHQMSTSAARVRAFEIWRDAKKLDPKPSELLLISSKFDNDEDRMKALQIAFLAFSKVWTNIGLDMFIHSAVVQVIATFGCDKNKLTFLRFVLGQEIRPFPPRCRDDIIKLFTSPFQSEVRDLFCPTKPKEVSFINLCDSSDPIVRTIMRDAQKPQSKPQPKDIPSDTEDVHIVRSDVSSSAEIFNHEFPTEEEQLEWAMRESEREDKNKEHSSSWRMSMPPQCHVTRAGVVVPNTWSVDVEKDEEKACTICFEHKPNATLLCGHRYCMACAMKGIEDQLKPICPSCQAPITIVIKAFD